MPTPAERALPTTDRAGGDGSGLPPSLVGLSSSPPDAAGCTPPSRPEALPRLGGAPEADRGARHGSAREQGGGRVETGDPPAREASADQPGSAEPSPLPRAPRRTRHRDSDLPARTPRIVHLDVDAFLASVEQAVHPELAGLPVVVGGLPHERNLVMSCSYPARAFGVRPGMLLAEAARLCPEAIFRRGDSQAANRLREELARILLRFTPKVEVASIDDFFADLTGTARLSGAACDVAERMREAIRAELALPVTIGVATNKTLARLAGKLAKPGGIVELLPGRERAFLAALPIEHLPGAGHAIGAALERFAIRTAGELALVSREILYASFGHHGLVLHQRARGIDPEPVEPTYVLRADGGVVARVPRSIRRDSTFEPEEGSREIVEAMLCYLVERAAHRLRSHRAIARTLTVRIVYVDTRPARARREDPGAGASFERRRKLTSATDATDAIWQAARTLLCELPRKRALTKRVGLSLSDFSARGGWQRELFDESGDAADLAADPSGKTSGARAESRTDRLRRLDDALDRVREKHGFGRVVRGTSFTLERSHPLSADGFRLRTPSLNQ